MSEEKSYIGTSLGNYRVIAELGSGGFGNVYRGEHTILTERTVAIKLLHAHLGDPEERERFLQEARLLERLKHPHILHILDVGIHDGFPYLIVEYAPGGSLRDLIKKVAPNPLPANIALNILTQVGQALSYAHHQNIIHRDLKPENILFNLQGEALLADFGVATTLSTSSIKYVTIIGSPSYMAPEQFESSVSKESDQYALGCIAYELFTGKRAFATTNFFSMGFDHINKAPIAPIQHNPYLPLYIEQAILKAMAKQRHDRHPDIYAFITALHPPTDAETQSPLPTLSATFLPNKPGTSMPTSNGQITQTSAISSANAFNAPQLDMQQRSNGHTPNNYHASLDARDAQTSRNPRYQEPETPIPPIHLSFLGAAPPPNSNSPYDQGPVTPIPPTSVPLQEMPHTSNEGSVAPFEAPITGNPSPYDMNTITNTAHPVKQRHSRRRRLLMAVASLLILASLLTALPMLFSHRSPQTQNKAQNGSTSLSTSQPLSTATLGTTPTFVPSLVPTNTLFNQPTQVPTTILVIIPTSTPTSTPTPSPTPTPTPIPATDTLTIYFINGMTGVYTPHSYKGKVTIHVTGAGEEYTNKWSDAFYQYTDAHGNPITPVHVSTYPGWSLWINGGVADNYVSPIPSYNSNHDYTFTITAPGGTLSFAIGDTYPKDNSGYLTATVTQD